MRKKILQILWILIGATSLFAGNLEIKEENPGEKYCFEVKKGFLVKEGEIFAGDESFPAVFILDTGACSSRYDSGLCPEIAEKIEKNDGIISASFEGVEIKNWRISSYILKGKLTEEYPENTFFILVGNDILIHKSLYLSILDGYFYWGENKNLSSSLKKHKLDYYEENRFGENCYRYSFFDEDAHFSVASAVSNDYMSRYLIDTGTYVASSSCKDYSTVVNEKNYKSFNHPAVPNGDFYHFGVCKVEKPVVLGEVFDFLYYSCGHVLLNEKVYGVQLLAAFDLFFECNDNGIAQFVYFYPQEKEKYRNFRLMHDGNSSVENFTYGFTVSWKNTVNAKYYMNGKELYPEISEGDEIIDFKETDVAA